MHIKSILLAAGAALSLAGATTADAATRLYTISGGTFSDGTGFTGSFNYDDSTDVYSLGSVSVTAGALSAFTYDTTTATPIRNVFGNPSVLFIDNAYSRYINLAFATSLAGSTGPVSLVPSSGFGSGSYECSNCTAGRFVTGGTVSATPAVPEPATWAMMIGGFGLMGATMRRRRTTVRYA